MILIDVFNCLDNFMGYNRKFRNIIGEIWRIVLNKIRKIIAVTKIFSIVIYKKNYNYALWVENYMQH